MLTTANGSLWLNIAPTKMIPTHAEYSCVPLCYWCAMIATCLTIHKNGQKFSSDTWFIVFIFLTYFHYRMFVKNVITFASVTALTVIQK
jgi:hypothetical protein